MRSINCYHMNCLFMYFNSDPLWWFSVLDEHIIFLSYNKSKSCPSKLCIYLYLDKFMNCENSLKYFILVSWKHVYICDDCKLWSFCIFKWCCDKEWMFMIWIITCEWRIYLTIDTKSFHLAELVCLSNLKVRFH